MNDTPKGQVPEALRLADIADDDAWAFVIAVRRDIAAELRRLHAQVAALTAQPDCLTCNDHGAVGNILTAEPCPDCTPAQPAATPSGAARVVLTHEQPSAVESNTAERTGCTAGNDEGCTRRGCATSCPALRASHGQAPAGAAQQAPAGATKQCPGIPRPGCNYLAECGRVCNKCGEVHAAHLLATSLPEPSRRRWSTYEAAVSDPVFQVARSIMGTENIGQDRQLVAAINHIIDAQLPPVAQQVEGGDAELLDFLCDPSRLRMVECEKSAHWRVYQDEAPAEAPQHLWQAMTSLWHPTARAAIAAARAAQKEGDAP